MSILVVRKARIFSRLGRLGHSLLGDHAVGKARVLVPFSWVAIVSEAKDCRAYLDRVDFVKID